MKSKSDSEDETFVDSSRNTSSEKESDSEESESNSEEDEGSWMNASGVIYEEASVIVAESVLSIFTLAMRFEIYGKLENCVQTQKVFC